MDCKTEEMPRRGWANHNIRDDSHGAHHLTHLCDQKGPHIIHPKLLLDGWKNSKQLRPAPHWIGNLSRQCGYPKRSFYRSLHSPQRIDLAPHLSCMIILPYIHHIADWGELHSCLSVYSKHPSSRSSQTTGRWFEPLRKIWVRQLGWLFHSQLNRNSSKSYSSHQQH